MEVLGLHDSVTLALKSKGTLARSVPSNLHSGLTLSLLIVITSQYLLIPHVLFALPCFVHHQV